MNANSKDQEVRDGFSIERNLEYDYILYERNKFGIYSRCDCCTAVSRHPSCALVPGSWFSLWLPGSRFFVFCLWCCSESEDSVNLLRIQRSNSLCDLVLFFLYIEFISSHDALHSVHNSLYLHTLPRCKLPSKTDSFLRSHGPDTLACKARPSFD